LPKYCQDMAYVENFSCIAYKDDLIEFQEKNRRILVAWEVTNRLNFDPMGPTAKVSPTAALLREPLIAPPFGASVTVYIHLSPDAYRHLASAIAGDGSQDRSRSGPLDEPKGES
jgi:hypothetical protein